MRFSTASAALSCVLLATLAGKSIALRPQREATPELFVNAAESILQSAGLTIHGVSRSPVAVISATSERCSVMIADYDPHGTSDTLLRKLYERYPNQYYVYAGNVLMTSPGIRALISYYIDRELLRIGFSNRRSPVALVANNEYCGKRHFEWEPLSRIQFFASPTSERKQ